MLNMTLTLGCHKSSPHITHDYKKFIGFKFENVASESPNVYRIVIVRQYCARRIILFDYMYTYIQLKHLNKREQI